MPAWRPSTASLAKPATGARTPPLDSAPPEDFYGRAVVAAADSGVADHIPRVRALFDLYEQELTLAAFIGFGVVLFGFVFRSWLR